MMWLNGRTCGTVCYLDVSVTWKPARKFVRLYSTIKGAKLNDDTIEI